MLLGRLLALGAMKKGLNVTWMPSYGAEVRGGTAHCMVVISDEEIASPVFSEYSSAIIMNRPSLDKFLPRIRTAGILVLNSSLAGAEIERKDIKIFKAPMTEIAHGIGNVKTANMVAMGVYLKYNRLFPTDLVKAGIQEAFPNNRVLIDLNIKAFEKGLGSI